MLRWTPKNSCCYTMTDCRYASALSMVYNFMIDMHVTKIAAYIIEKQC